jgi:hypothetical protein
LQRSVYLTIAYSQLRMRKKLEAEGVKIDFKMWMFPYLTQFFRQQSEEHNNAEQRCSVNHFFKIGAFNQHGKNTHLTHSHEEKLV